MANEMVRLTSGIFEENVPIMLNRYAYDNFSELKMHSHDFVEIAYVCQGSGIHVFGNQKQDVSRGDLCIINIDTPHCFYPTDPANTDGLAVYNCMFMPSFLESLAIKTDILRQVINLFLYQSLYSEETAHAPDLHLSGRHQIDIESIYEAMLREYDTRDEGYIDALQLLFGRLLIVMYRAARQGAVDIGDEDLYRQRLISHAIDFLQGNFAGKLSLDRISQQAYLSKSYFSALFKKTTGISVFDYIQKLRIDQACRLLAETRDQVAVIASAVGYKDYRFFNEKFKKLTGMTALAYRRQSQK